MSLDMKIRIDHYSLKKKKYEEYHQELVDLTLDELIELFRGLPKKDDFPDNPVNVITKDYVFLKKTDDIIRIVPNITGFSFFPQLGDPFIEEKIFGHKSVEYNINDIKLRSFISKEAIFKTSMRSTIRNLLLTGFFPLINMALIIYTILIFNLNFGIIICFVVLLILSIFNLVSIIQSRFKKPFQFKKLKYELLILEKLKPIDISQLVLSLSQCFYLIIFIVFSFYLGNQLYRNIISIVFVLSFAFLLRNVMAGYVLIKILYLRARVAKELLQEIILRNYYDDIVKEKSHYINLYNLVKSERLIKFGLITKLITIITFSFTLISILIITL